MTTADPAIKDEDYTVHVKAQVMTRDESTGGWVPLGGGGMSVVGLQRLTTPQKTAADVPQNMDEYRIIGQKISDQTVILNCALKEDLKYTRANPTFHHWLTDDKRFGLTFQSSADAHLFERSIRDALKLIHGGVSLLEVDVTEEELTLQNVPIEKKTSTPSAGTPSVKSLEVTTSEVSSQGPATGKEGVSGSGIGGGEGSDPTPADTTQHLYKVHCIIKPSASRSIPLSSHIPQTSRTSSSPRTWRTRKFRSEDVSGALISSKNLELIEKEPSEKDNNDTVKSSEQGSSSTNDDVVEMVEYSYVQFSKAHITGTTHEYSYPVVELLPQLGGGSQARLEPSHESSLAGSCSPRIPTEAEPSTSQLPLPMKTKSRHKIRLKRGEPAMIDRQLLGQQSPLAPPRLQCVYCHEVFDPDSNRLGSCRDAPDRVQECIEWVACACCARGMLYHCLSDADGNYGHPCKCEPSDESPCKKWTALALLSLVVPCLWCYWPLTACHRGGMQCGCCGPQHVMAST